MPEVIISDLVGRLKYLEKLSMRKHIKYLPI